MITKENGELVVTCDECEDNKVYGGTTDDFAMFVKEVKAQGWRIDKVDGYWHHTCPECVNS